MANLRDIRRRIRSVKNTQQITRAMKMVSAAKLRRSQDRILAARPYALELRKVVERLAAQRGEQHHRLLEEREEKRVLLAVVTGDRGLAGAFNANVLRQAQQTIARLEGDGVEVDLLLLGKKGADFYRSRRVRVWKSFTTLFTNVSYADAAEIAGEVSRRYAAREVDAVHVIYNQFESILRQALVGERLLPIAAPPAVAEAAVAGGGVDYLYEPSAGAVLAEILPRYVTFQVYRMLLESQAAEHAARMTAMDSATKNASDMIDRLTLDYNQARQAAITTELIEVVSGAAALGG